MRRVGIIGCGAVAEKSYAKVLPLIPGVRVTLVADVSEMRAIRLAKALGCTIATVAELLNEVDTAIIATPPETHRDLTEACLRAGVSVLCEKPFVLRHREAKAVIALAAELKVALYIGHFRRVFPSVRLARELVTSGAFGRVREIRAFEGGRFTWIAHTGYTHLSSLGGVLCDTGSHTLDMALFSCGLDEGQLDAEISRYSADKPEPANEVEMEGTLVTSAGRISLRVALSRNGPLANCVAVECERATITISTGAKNAVRVTGPLGAVTVQPCTTEWTLQQCFATQCKEVLTGDGSAFEGARFLNLTTLLDRSLAAAGT